MNTNENQCAGPKFDWQKAADIRSGVLKEFTTKYKKIERIAFGWIIFLLALAGFAAFNFFHGDNTQDWILHGIILLIACENIILIKLWYWIMNDKLGVLRDLKLLRVELGIQKHPTLSQLEGIDQIQPKTPGISRRERRIWQFVIILLAAIVGFMLPNTGLISFGKTPMESMRTIVIDQNGNARIETNYRLTNTRSRRIREFSIFAGGSISEPRIMQSEESNYTDGFGRKLPVRVEPAGSNHRNVIGLDTPVEPGETFTIRSISKQKAVKQNDIWIFKTDQMWSYHKNIYKDNIILPENAEVVAIEPAAVSQEVRDGHAVIKFENVCGPNEKWPYTIKYRLSEKSHNKQNE